MKYNEIYNICQPVMDWLKEQYPNHHKIAISPNGAQMIECDKISILSNELKASTDGKDTASSILDMMYENVSKGCLKGECNIKNDTKVKEEKKEEKENIVFEHYFCDCCRPRPSFYDMDSEMRVKPHSSSPSGYAVWYGAGNAICIPVWYCPKCGRKLSEVSVNGK